MKKIRRALILSCCLLIPLSSYGEEISSEDELSYDFCSGIMSAQELKSEALSLRDQGSEAGDYYSSYCLLIGAHKGDGEAQYELSKYYRAGIGLPSSNIYAYKWIKISEISGYEVPKEEIEALENSLGSEDLRRGIKLIESHYNFIDNQGQKKKQDSLAYRLSEMGIVDISEEQLLAIQEAEAKLENDLKVEGISDNSKSTVSELTTSRTSRVEPVSQRDSSSVVSDAQARRAEIEKRIAEARAKAAQQREQASTARSRDVDMEDMDEFIEEPMPMEEFEEEIEVKTSSKSSSKNSKSSSTNSKSSSRGIDFLTDPYNPQFSTP